MNLQISLQGLSGALVGLCLGSFLNVVIHRLPKRMEAVESQALLEAIHARDAVFGQIPAVDAQAHAMGCPSHCPHCLHPIAWRHNLPLLGFFFLRGRCASCGDPISWRYPLVELLSALWLAYCCIRWEMTAQSLAIGGAGLCLLALAAIDMETMLLPDALTYPLLWSGLLCASAGWHPVLLHDALWGAMLGYGLLAAAAILFKRTTGKQGLGDGDAKLFAALGAWQGWMALPYLLLIASVGSVLWILWRNRGKQKVYHPFGPWLAATALILWLPR